MPAYRARPRTARRTARRPRSPTDRRTTHDHEHSELDEIELRVRALRDGAGREGLRRPGRARRASSRPTRRRIGPRNGARVVARAWADPAYRALAARATRRRRSPRSATRAARASTWWRWRTRRRCTTWSSARCARCYPWPVLGLPPVWYKSAPYRSRAVRDPRGVLRDFGVELPDGTRDPRLGFDRGDALPRRAAAAGGHRRLERGAARGARDARLDDRHRPAASPRRARSTR